MLNVSGHRMGTMEIESALVAMTDLVAEAAVVGRPDDTTGEAICAFVVLKRARPTGEEAKQIAAQLRAWVGKEIGPIAKPKDIRFGDNLPKQRRWESSLGSAVIMSPEGYLLTNNHVTSGADQISTSSCVEWCQSGSYSALVFETR